MDHEIDPEGLPVEAWDAYDAAAEGVARGVMPPVTLTTAALIDYDHEEFMRRVRAFQYAHAMEGVDVEDDTAWRLQAIEPRE